MPVFQQTMRRTDNVEVAEALRIFDRHIRWLQEQLEWQLLNLDSSNINEIDTSQTTISSGDGGVAIDGDELILSGNRGERFRVGQDKAAGRFRFEVTDRSGQVVMYLSSDGELTITRRANVAIDCGTW